MIKLNQTEKTQTEKTKTVIIHTDYGKVKRFTDIGSINISSDGNVGIKFTEKGEIEIRHDFIKPYKIKRIRKGENEEGNGYSSPYPAEIFINRR